MEEALKPKKISLIESSAVVPVTSRQFPFTFYFNFTTWASTYVSCVEKWPPPLVCVWRGVSSGSLVKNRLAEYLCPIQDGKTLLPSWWRCIVDQTPFSLWRILSALFFPFLSVMQNGANPRERPHMDQFHCKLRPGLLFCHGMCFQEANLPLVNMNLQGKCCINCNLLECS